MQTIPRGVSTKGPAEMFTGDVYFDVIAKGDEPSRLRVNTVHLAMWEAPDPRSGEPETVWGEHVTDTEYQVREGAQP